MSAAKKTDLLQNDPQAMNIRSRMMDGRLISTGITEMQMTKYSFTMFCLINRCGIRT